MNSLNWKFFFYVLLFVFIAHACLFGQKSVLKHDIYEKWKLIKHEKISNNGQWCAWDLWAEKGDGYAYLSNPDKNMLDSIIRGEKPDFCPESNYFVCLIKPQYDSVRQLKLKKTKKDDLPKDTLYIRLLDNNQAFRFANLESFKIPEKSGEALAFITSSLKKEPENDNSDSTEEKKKKEKHIKILNIFFPVTNDTILFEGADNYVWSGNGKYLLFSTIINDSTDSVHLNIFDAERKIAKTIFEAKGTIKNICVNENGKKWAFLYSDDTSKTKNFGLFYYEKNNPNPIVRLDSVMFDDASEYYFPSENQNMFFREDGAYLFFGISEKNHEPKKDSLLDEEKVNVDIWNYKDKRLQSQQLAELKKDREHAFLTALETDSRKYIILEDNTIEYVRVNKRSKTSILMGFDYEKYGHISSWESPSYKDVYLIDLKTRDKKRILTKHQYSVDLSPDGSYLAYYRGQDSTWQLYDVAKKNTIDISSQIPYPIYNELSDYSFEPNPYGITGWTEDEEHIWLYDQFDLWQVSLNNPDQVSCITMEKGRQKNIRFRYEQIDRKELFIDPDENVLLSAFNKTSKESGFYRLSRKNNDYRLEKLLMTDFDTKIIKVSEDQSHLLWTKSSFRQFPDLLYGSLDFNDEKKISNANPIQHEYNWGTVELYSWTDFNGDSLSGLLYKPEDYSADSAYPLLVYFYERYADRLHMFWHPLPSRSIINPSIYCSNGYMVFIPDIKYERGYPGKSSYNCVVSGVKSLTKDFPSIDVDKMGIQGQSWGGYQVAYLVTETNLFACAMAGAPVSNMTSAYGGIRWNSGKTRMFQYEEGQSRIGATLWERRDLYVLNSPLFFADQVNTPLLMMHNDDDGAVPWWQSLEYFNALRRLNKPVWLLVYNKEEHNLRRWPNRIDLSIRMMQFFDHYLKGAKQPLWMQYGIPAIDKEEKRGYETE